MLVKEIQHSNIAGREFTTLVFEHDTPKTPWRSVVIDGNALRPVFQSSIPDYMRTFEGSIEPKSMQVDFV